MFMGFLSNGPRAPELQGTPERLTCNYCGIVNKMVQIRMVGLNIKLTSYIAIWGGDDSGSNTGKRIMDSLFFFLSQ